MTWASTVIVLACILFASASLAYASIQNTSAGNRSLGIVLALIIVLVLTLVAVAGLYAPRKYVVDLHDITIARIGPDVHIPLSDLTNVKAIELHRVIRLFGCGGLFGAWGWFSSRELRCFRAYVTNRHELVVIWLKHGKPVVLSPEDPGAFMEAVKTAVANDAATSQRIHGPVLI